MRKDVLAALGRLRRLRALVDRAELLLSALSADDQLMLEILLDEDNEKVARICEEFSVSSATGYRYVNDLLEEISHFFKENGIEIP